MRLTPSVAGSNSLLHRRTSECEFAVEVALEMLVSSLDS